MHEPDFSALPALRQIQLVLLQGTYLTWRCQGAGSVHLYHLPGLAGGTFVELYYNAGLDQLRVVRAFTDTEPLASYLTRLVLPAWLPR